MMRTIVTTEGGCDLLKHRVLANVFFEPSTRTSTSFATAMLRMGGSVTQITESASSAVKGETISDTMKTLACYADVIVLRHPVRGTAAAAAAAISKPFINAGDGVGEHPTQALLDFYTILAELGGVVDRTVVMMGDLKNGRTVHSLALLLALMQVKLVYVSPPELRMPEYVKAAVAARGIEQVETDVLDDVLPSADVLYVTRVQKERFATTAEYERLKHAYIVTRDTMTHAKEKMVVMHPLPRVGEIAEEVDADPRAAYFRQMQYGLYIRMALLAVVCGITQDQIAAIALKDAGV